MLSFWAKHTKTVPQCPFADSPGSYHCAVLISCASSVLAPVLITLITLQVALVLESPVLVLFSLLFATMFDQSNFCHYQKSCQSSLSWLLLLLKIQLLQTRFFCQAGLVGILSEMAGA